MRCNLTYSLRTKLNTYIVDIYIQIKNLAHRNKRAKFNYFTNYARIAKLFMLFHEFFKNTNVGSLKKKITMLFNNSYFAASPKFVKKPNQKSRDIIVTEL